MLLKRLLCGVLALVIVAAGGYYALTFRFFDRPLTAQAQKEFEEQVALPINFTLAASVDSFESAKNSMAAVREGVRGSSYALELNIAFDKRNVPYLADGSEYITDSSVLLEDVFKTYAKTDYLRFILHLTAFPEASKFVQIVRRYKLDDRILLTGFTKDDLESYGGLYAMFRLCMTADKDFGDFSDPKVCDDLMVTAQENGATGLLCSISDVTPELRAAASAVGGQFRLLVYGADSAYDMYYAMSLNPDVIITSRPDELYERMISGDYLNVDRSAAF